VLLNSTLSAPLFTGSRHPGNVVPGRYDVSLGGRPYLVDMLRAEMWRHRTVPLLRQQADNSNEPSEASLNPEDLWRRSFTSWHRGAGQTYADGPTAREPHRFLSSKGVDVLTNERQVTLLKKATLTVSPVTVAPVVVGDFLYAANGSTLVRLGDTSTTVTGSPSSVLAMASDGYYMWSAHGANGVYQSASSSTTTASYATGTVTGLAYVAGRLMAWNGGSLYNIVAAGALPAALMTKTNWEIVGCAEAAGWIYVAAHSDDKSLIYKTSIKADGTSLDAPSVAAALPDGEVAAAIYGYLGFILIGTNRGVRFATQDSAGNLVLGKTIDIDRSVTCFEGEGPFVWFGWSNFDADSTGLGRVDLTTINEGNAPAYASDLMADGQGNVSAVTTWRGRRVFWLEGSGYWAEEPTELVASGTITSGRVTYGLTDNKVVKRVDAVLSAGSAGSATIALSTDDGAYRTLGTITAGGDGVLPAARARGQRFQVQATLTRDASDVTAGPTLEWITLRAYPSLGTTEVITVPVLLWDRLDHDRGVTATGPSPAQELANLRGLRDLSQLVSYQEGNANYQVLVTGVDWLPERKGRDAGVWNGVALITLKTFGGLVE
jgi:hypothetical protein